MAAWAEGVPVRGYVGREFLRVLFPVAIWEDYCVQLSLLLQVKETCVSTQHRRVDVGSIRVLVELVWG